MGETEAAALLGKPASRAERRTTVLLAEVRNSSEADPGAAGALARTVEVLRQAAELSGGRVLQDRKSAVVALFSTPDAAAAAARMHAYAETLPPTPRKPGVGIALHAGPVAQRNEDVFGDTVDLAVQLAGAAKDGQILISHDTASILSPAIQSSVRPADHVRLNGEDSELLLGELVWRNPTNQIVSALGKAAGARAGLRLTCGGKALLRRRERDSVSLGRDADCDLSIGGGAVSRKHCTIVRRDAAFVLRDHSSNGTFVTMRGQGEVRVLANELALAGSGCIALGQPANGAAQIVNFVCE
jgi:class 3 adenylate cyclase